jgi:hypothetical protein
MQITPTQYTGRKARVGGICFDQDRMRIFVGYCPNCNGKVVMSLDDAKAFANRYATEVDKHKVKRLLKTKIKFDI